MTLFNFKTDVVLEATSEEDALQQVANRIAVIARQIGNEADLDSNDPFFTLTTVTKGEPADLQTDPIAEAMRADGEFGEPEPTATTNAPKVYANDVEALKAAGLIDQPDEPEDTKDEGNV
jgi:hypothetical protein